MELIMLLMEIRQHIGFQHSEDSLNDTLKTASIAVQPEPEENAIKHHVPITSLSSVTLSSLRNKFAKQTGTP